MLRRYAGLNFHTVDAISIGYMAAVGLVIPIFHRVIPNWHIFFAIHLAYCVLGLESIRASSRRPDSTPLAWLRMLYPAVIIVYGFLEVGKLQHYLSGGHAWLTDYLVAADYATFGVHPTVWFKDFFNPWLDEFMAVFRILYYVVPLAILYPLLRANRRDAVLASGAIVIATYVANYLAFLLLPAVSPRMVPAIASADLREYSGFVFSWLEHAIQGEQGAVTGAAFPSAHVSGTVAWTFVAYRYLPRWVGHLMVFISLGTAVSAVYLGFHHAMDPLGGLVLAMITCPLAIYFVKKQSEPDPVYVVDGVNV